MLRALIAGLFLAFATSAVAVPLSNWSLNLGALGGSNATGIIDVTLDGFSQLDQTIAGNSAIGNAFTFSGSLGWIQYQANGVGAPASFGLPGAYSDLFFRFSGLTGTLDAFGNATFVPGGGSIGLYLDNGGSLIPSVGALTLATFNLGPGSSAEDIAYYDGLSAAPYYTLNFRLISALAGLLTDDQSNPILPGADFTAIVDGLLDLNFPENPSAVPSGDGTSINILVNAGYIGAVNVQGGPAVPPNPIPEPGSLLLIALGLMGIVGLRSQRNR